MEGVWRSSDLLFLAKWKGKKSGNSFFPSSSPSFFFPFRNSPRSISLVLFLLFLASKFSTFRRNSQFSLTFLKIVDPCKVIYIYIYNLVNISLTFVKFSSIISRIFSNRVSFLNFLFFLSQLRWQLFHFPLSLYSLRFNSRVSSPHCRSVFLLRLSERESERTRLLLSQ